MTAKRHPERGNRLLKFVDRYIGIPIVFILGLSRKKATKPPQNISKIALLKTAGIGDTVLLSGVIQDTRKQLPNCQITLICGRNNEEIAQLIKEIDDVAVLDIKRFLNSIKKIKSLPLFDVWLDFGPWPRFNSILTHFAKARFKVGFKTKWQFRHYVYDKIVDHIGHIPNYHELFNYRNIVNTIGVTGNSLPHISIDSSSMAPSNKQIAVHIFPGGSRSYLKEWPDKYWVQLLDWFIAQNYDIYLTGGPADFERLEKIRCRVSNPNQILNTAGKSSLRDTATILCRSKLVISVDTGTMHLAGALDCNLISIHGPTAPGRWGAMGAKTIAVNTTRACSPCIDLGFDSNCRDNKCMSDITPQIIIEKCKIALTS